MTGIDWVIVLFTVVLAGYGYRQGFLVGALSLVGFAVGAYLGTRLAPLLLDQGARSPFAPLLGLLGAILAGGVLASGLEGLASRARAALPIPGLRAADGLLGAGLTACVGLGVVWIIGAVVLQASASAPLRGELQRSAILTELDAVLPPSGAILNALARFDPQPGVRGPVADVPAPARGSLARAGVRAAARSVVRVTGTACGLGVEGSGWVSGPDAGGLVVTNAHVVAGTASENVRIQGVGRTYEAHVIVFDPRRDLAVLSVPGLPAPSSRQGPSLKASGGAVVAGFPLDGPFRLDSARVRDVLTATGADIYGTPGVVRQVYSLYARVQPGNSGGPLLSPNGSVVGIVFARSLDNDQTGYALTLDEARPVLDAANASTDLVSTGACVAG